MNRSGAERAEVARQPKIVSRSRKQIKQTPLKVRREIYRLHHNSGISIKSLAETYGLSYQTIVNITSGRTNLTAKKRIAETTRRTKQDVEDYKQAKAKTITELLEDRSERMLRSLYLTKLKVMDEARVLEIASRVKRATDASKLEAHLKRPDAEVIARSLRKLKPDLTDERIIQIVNEVLTEIKAEP